MTRHTTININKSNEEPSLLIAVGGPTASGKTALGVGIAHALGGEILSADSRQVYRRMDIGTGKDLVEYSIYDDAIAYHLIDIEEPGKVFDLYHWLAAFRNAYQEIVARGKRPILVGGTGLYLESALRGVSLSPIPQNPELRAQLEPCTTAELQAILQRYADAVVADSSNPRRLIRAIEIASYREQHPERCEEMPSTPLPHLLLYINMPTDVVDARIRIRLKQRLEHGLIEEVEQLLKEGVTHQQLDSYGLEYRFISQYLLGNLSLQEMTEKLAIAIRQFAKRQRTWFRGMERRGFQLHALDGTLPPAALLEEALATIAQFS